MLERDIIEKLNEANKLIFVKEYKEAQQILGKLVRDDLGANLMLIHLRRIELCAKVETFTKLKKEYLEMLAVRRRRDVASLCLIFIELMSEEINASEAIARFQSFLKNIDPHAAAAHYGIGLGLETLGNHDRAIYSYEQALSHDPKFYPAYFGLSQLYYQKGDEKSGDRFFYMFEEEAPYNVYGNFETHKKLFEEFIQRSRFDAAQNAMMTLSEWWYENRNFCPTEIQIYEAFALSRLARERGDAHGENYRRDQARALARSVLEDERKVKESVFFFIARILEEFSELQLAVEFYKRVLRLAGDKPDLVQKVGSQFLSLGEYKLAKDLFEDAYEVHPNNQEIRFCLLVAKLKIAGVNVEEYLLSKERLKKTSGSGADRVEALALLHAMMSKFQDDPDVRMHIGEIYLKLGNIDRANKEFSAMFQLDPRGATSSIKYASYHLNHGDADIAIKVLEDLKKSELKETVRYEVIWLEAHYHFRAENYEQCRDLLSQILITDPWNVSYLVLEAAVLTQIMNGKNEDLKLDSELEQLLSDNDSEVNWVSFDRTTKKLESGHHYRLAYVRRKLRYLYAEGDQSSLLRLVLVAARYNAATGNHDFLRLLNTNFDSPDIAWALGLMNKELWRLETASTWFEEMLHHPKVSNPGKARAFLELADCYVWMGRNFDKAIELAKMALDMGETANGRTLAILVHSYLRAGKIREAESCLATHNGKAHEVEYRYLKGLISYRNGDTASAKRIWKPILTVQSESIRYYQIKQEVQKYYFGNAPYMKVN